MDADLFLLCVSVCVSLASAAVNACDFHIRAAKHAKNAKGAQRSFAKSEIVHYATLIY